MTSAAEAEEWDKVEAQNQSETLGELLAKDANLKNAEIKKVFDELKSTVTDVKNENAFLKKLNAELVLQIAQLKDQNADMKDGIDFLGDEMFDLKSQMADLKKDLKDLKNDIPDPSQMVDLKKDLKDLKNDIPDPALAFLPRVLEIKKLAQDLEPSAVEAHEVRKNALKMKADNKRAMLEGDGSTWLVENFEI